MRWYRNRIQIKDTRIKTSFLWFPKEINDETRWLERATWKEEVIPTRYGLKWTEKCWLGPRSGGREVN